MTLAALSLPVLDPAAAASAMVRLRDNLNLAVSGKAPQVTLAITCAVAQGHLLIEDVPGVGKTTLAEAFARSAGLSFARLQFTADLLPAEVIGVQVFHAPSASFEFRPGPLFRQMVVADELNRAPPRTQSALLEALAQGQVSVDGVTHALPSPFLVIATQNPLDLAGTYPLPDSQLDRFLMRLSLGYPSPEVETEVLRTRGPQEPLRTLPSVMRPDELSAVQRLAAGATVDRSVAEYAVRLLQETRKHPKIDRGGSTRAALALIAAAKAHALWDARHFVTPQDVKSMWSPVMAHRLMLKSSAAGAFGREEAATLLQDIARTVPVPR